MAVTSQPRNLNCILLNQRASTGKMGQMAFFCAVCPRECPITFHGRSTSSNECAYTGEQAMRINTLTIHFICLHALPFHTSHIQAFCIQGTDSFWDPHLPENTRYTTDGSAGSEDVPYQGVKILFKLMLINGPFCKLLLFMLVASRGPGMNYEASHSDSRLDFCLAAEEDSEQVLSIYVKETDYMASTYHDWLQERNRMVILGKQNGRMVATLSIHIVDDGQTALMEGIRIVTSERGKGFLKSLYQYGCDLVGRTYPAVTKQTFLVDSPYYRKFHIINKQSLISLQFPSINAPTLVSEVISNMKKSGAKHWEPSSLKPDDVRSVFLNRTVIDTVLPGRRIIQRGSVFKPLESNLDILLKRDISWIADRKENTRAVSLGTAPYRDPMGNYVYRIDIFGKDLSAVKSVFLSQLQNLPLLQGNVICLLSVNPSLSPQMWEFCTKEVGLKKGKQYWKDEFIIEGDLIQNLFRG
ncbi:histidine N-acetyltransferase-like [Heterodontus francisci]|uniref:histidine N-acetyltransferase-like n=1 Tax=Heterodontus francisci TaxID=7792 RepID=UPI00355BDABB